MSGCCVVTVEPEHGGARHVLATFSASSIVETTTGSGVIRSRTLVAALSVTVMTGVS